MTHYVVVSPEVTLYSGSDWNYEPPEYGSCVVSVEATNKRKAKILALKTDGMAKWLDEARGDDKNPFSGLEILDPVCKHGVCWCDICKGECEECYKELEAEAN